LGIQNTNSPMMTKNYATRFVIWW